MPPSARVFSGFFAPFGLGCAGWVAWDFAGAWSTPVFLALCASSPVGTPSRALSPCLPAVLACDGGGAPPRRFAAFGQARSLREGRSGVLRVCPVCASTSPPRRLGLGGGVGPVGSGPLRSHVCFVLPSSSLSRSSPLVSCLRRVSRFRWRGVISRFCNWFPSKKKKKKKLRVAVGASVGP